MRLRGQEKKQVLHHPSLAFRGWCRVQGFFTMKQLGNTCRQLAEVLTGLFWESDWAPGWLLLRK